MYPLWLFWCLGKLEKWLTEHQNSLMLCYGTWTDIDVVHNMLLRRVQTARQCLPPAPQFSSNLVSYTWFGPLMEPLQLLSHICVSHCLGIWFPVFSLTDVEIVCYRVPTEILSQNPSFSHFLTHFCLFGNYTYMYVCVCMFYV